MCITYQTARSQWALLVGTMLSESLDIKTAIAGIVRAEGNLNLAAERLGAKVPDVLGALTESPEGFRMLAEQLRVLQLLKTFHLLQTAEAYMVGIMGDMEAPDVVKAYNSVATLFGSLTSQASKEPSIVNNIDVTSIMLNALPAPVREAFLTLVQPDDVFEPVSTRQLRQAPGPPRAKEDSSEYDNIGSRLPIGLEARRRMLDDEDMDLGS